MLFLICASSTIQAFVPATLIHGQRRHLVDTLRCPARGVVSRLTSTEVTTLKDHQDYDGAEDDEEDEDVAFLFQNNGDEEHVSHFYDDLDVTEKVWRHAKKPLLRIGSKGATHSHGNSLRQLLEDHTVVRVKVNTKKFHDSLEEAYHVLRDLAIENGAPQGLELIQLREGSKEVVFGMPGTLEKMQQGTFPPKPKPYDPNHASSSKLRA